MTVPPILGTPAYYYAYDSFDTGPQVAADGTIVPGVRELHYSLDWTGNSDHTTDPGNQLKYPNAPEDSTVLFWSTHQAAFAGSDRVPVLMLNGYVKPANAITFQAKGPLDFKF